MTSTDDTYIHFYDNYVPTLKAANYRIEVSQTLVVDRRRSRRTRRPRSRRYRSSSRSRALGG